MEPKMDMRISGSGNMPGGEYGSVRISGSGRVNGFVRCDELSVSGSGKLEGVACAGDIRASGSAMFEGDVKAKEMRVSGACKITGGVEVQADISVSGALRVEKNMSCSLLKSTGALAVDGDVEAEKAEITGKIIVGGLLNAEEVHIRFDTGTEFGSIGGSRIHLEPGYERRGGLFGWFGRRGKIDARVNAAIEGDEIFLENVICPRVSGRTVTVGEGCRIDLVQYGERIEVSPNATVGKQEKI